MTGLDPRGTALLDSIVTVTRATFGARAASIMLHDAEDGELVFAAVAGEGSGELVGRRISADTGVAGWVLAAQQPLAIEDVTQDPRFASGVAQSTGYVPKGLMAAPLLGDEAALGVLSVLDRPERSEFSLVELDLLGLIAGQAALAVELARGDVREADAAPEAVRALAGAVERLQGDRRAAAISLLEALRRLLR